MKRSQLIKAYTKRIKEANSEELPEIVEEIISDTEILLRQKTVKLGYELKDQMTEMAGEFINKLTATRRIK